ncbi:hypothetical protein GP486_007012 [Trichoglossum hirsutum]|uniref:Uncharacterized protein n=1 Tax=Trichoglossum hirsutum TaxID=265104 RepID=A0A9P8L557_9PEZI|nr:hypothetical protein GP486_007012 [Trichoglossum hirsutum]
MSSSDEARRQLGGVNGGNRQGSAASFSANPVLNPPTRILYGPGSPMASRNASVSGPDSYSVWAREPMVALTPRASRASSVVSTRTITSISTDHNDGCNGNEEANGSEGDWGRLDGHLVPINHTNLRQASYGDTISEPQGYPNEHSSLTPQETGAGDPTGADLPQSQTGSTGPDLSRNPSFTPGKETISVRKRPESSSYSSPTSASRTESPGSPSNRLRRSGGIKLRVVTSTGQAANGVSPASAGSDLWPRSAESRVHSAEADLDHAPHSPTFIGRAATGIFPSPRDLSDINGGYAKVNLQEGKAKRTSELPPHNTQARDSSNSRNERGSYRSFSPGATRRPRHGPISHDSGTNLSGNEDTQPILAPRSPVQINGNGVQPSPAMNSQNNLSIHHSQTARMLDQTYQKEMRERDEVIRGLTRTILDLRAELGRTRDQVQTAKATAPILLKEDTPEARAFSFPPLKLRHITTLRRAIERRAEKLNLGSGSNSHTKKQPTASVSDGGGRTANLPSRINPNLNLQAENEGLKGMLCASQAKIEGLELEVRELQKNLEFWMNRSDNPEPRPNRDDAEREFKEAIGRTREEVNMIWESRWKSNNEQLLDRMRRIENESQRLIKSAVEERDEEWAVTWAKKNAYLLTRLKDKEVELKELKNAEARKDEGHEAQVKALEKRLAAEEHHTSVLQEMLLDLETQHARTKSELQDLRCMGRAPNQVSPLSP